jgi:nucleotide-binding universal stress UspA family protein
MEAKTGIAIKNILFATDFSPIADAAVPFAIQIALNYDAKILGVHVNKFNDYTAVAPDIWPAMLEAAEDEDREDTQRLEDQLGAVSHEVVIGKGRVSEVISHLIQENHIDLVILGTHGRKGFGHALLGSVAEEILRKSPCPVMTVGPQVTVAPNQAVKMHEIVCATDLVEPSPAAASYAVSMAEENQAHLTLLHVIEHRVDTSINTEIVDSRVRRLRELAEGADLACQPAYHVDQGIAAEKILEFAETQGADLIVLGARPAGGLARHLNAGTVHEVVSQAKCPVLTVRG